MVSGVCTWLPSRKHLSRGGVISEGVLRELKQTKQHAHNLFNFSSMEQWVAYLNDCPDFPTKAAILDTATAGCLVGIPFTATKNILCYYPERDISTKGHLG